MLISVFSDDTNLRLASFTLLICLTINYNTKNRWFYKLRQRHVDWGRVYLTILVLLSITFLYSKQMIYYRTSRFFHRSALRPIILESALFSCCKSVQQLLWFLNRNDSARFVAGFVSQISWIRARFIYDVSKVENTYRYPLQFKALIISIKPSSEFNIHS